MWSLIVLAQSFDFGAIESKLEGAGLGRGSISYVTLAIILGGLFMMRDRVADALGFQLVKKGEAPKTAATPGGTSPSSPADPAAAAAAAAPGGRPTTDLLYRTMVEAGATTDKVDAFIKENWEKIRPQQLAK
jgi:hypothetical protein